MLHDGGLLSGDRLSGEKGAKTWLRGHRHPKECSLVLRVGKKIKQQEFESFMNVPALAGGYCTEALTIQVGASSVLWAHGRCRLCNIDGQFVSLVVCVIATLTSPVGLPTIMMISIYCSFKRANGVQGSLKTRARRIRGIGVGCACVNLKASVNNAR